MKLSHVLSAVKGAGSEKTASAAPVKTEEKAVTSTEAALKTAVEEALTSANKPAEKQAASTPVADVEKIASQVVASDNEALLKEAKVYGAAVADGFMERLSQYNEAAEKLAAQNPTPAAPAKTAAVDNSFDKFAAENKEIVQDAFALGHQTASDQMQKLASAAYNKGYDEATDAIYKLASACFIAGYQACDELLKNS